MDLTQTILYVAAVWGLPYRERMAAKEQLPCGVDADVELSLAIAGRLHREPSFLVDPVFDPLCPAVLANLAAELNIEPKRLRAALIKAIDRQIANRSFQPAAGYDPDGQHAKAIAAAVDATSKKLKRVRRNGNTRFQPARPARFTRRKVNVRNPGN
ncbi:MAG: hypothetical protein AAGI54_00705 [Planctomycetota bacterium]